MGGVRCEALDRVELARLAAVADQLELGGGVWPVPMGHDPERACELGPPADVEAGRRTGRVDPRIEQAAVLVF